MSMGFSAVLVGDQSLLIQCAEILRAEGHTIAGVMSTRAEIRAWATGEGLPFADLEDVRATGETPGIAPADWLFSIANLTMLPEGLLALGRTGAVNFHDGPLPGYAGLNTPVWALMADETRHAITWHMMEAGVDTGDIVATQSVDIAPDETAFTLNARCYAAALESFPTLVGQIAAGHLTRTPQEPGATRRVFTRRQRPEANGLLDPARPAEDLARLVRALDHGGYWNPLCRAKIALGGEVYLIGQATPGDTTQAAPGTVIAAGPDSLTLATGNGVLMLSELNNADGGPVPDLAGFAGQSLDAPDRAALTEALQGPARHDGHWRKTLTAMEPAALPASLCGAPTGAGETLTQSIALPGGLKDACAATALWAVRLSGQAKAALGWAPAAITEAAKRHPGHLSSWVPVTIGVSAPDTHGALKAAQTALQEASIHGSFARDLVARDPALAGCQPPPIALAETDAPVTGAALTVSVGTDTITLHGDPAHLDAAALEALAERLSRWLGALAEDPSRPLAALSLLTEAEAAAIGRANATETTLPEGACLHQAFEHLAETNAQADAILFRDTTLSYGEIEARANRLAHRLQTLGVGPDTPVGLHVPRGPDLIIGALAILKAGGAYLPLDPAYPADRVEFYLTDSRAPVVISHSEVAADLPKTTAEVLEIDTLPDDGPETRPASPAGLQNLAYLIYTSGSTGKPKGVMVEHGNVVNFFAGMDAVIPHDSADGQPTWLAVTSLSFDISVLELFWTLARGMRVVIATEEDRLGGAMTGSAGDMAFSLYYWGNDDGLSEDKYRLLLDGAKFADKHGFTAVWTPERHFHAFGGPYPNPAVTGAAVAAVTENIAVRAGSCVAPLHHPARIAEEWAVIDNMTNGRTGLAMASGWQPDDFVLRPENTPPANRDALFATIEQVQRLWRGEAVAFPRADGEMHEVVTQPRPVSKELNLWVTTAGNPKTWEEAGTIGANVLTHLLGQTVAEVEEKIGIYRRARAEAGHAGPGHVTLMLHTFLGEDRETVRETARGPMIAYLRSAAFLIKQYAWAFPAFKRPEGAASAFDLDLSDLAPDEMEAVLDFAYQRYFEDSGLFGTVADAEARVAEVKAAGVDEVACLIDYGIAVDTVLEGLKPLAEVVAAHKGEARDFSLPAQIQRHGVTHLQMTPAMARMLAEEGEASGLDRVRHLMIGGEALPGALVADLKALTDAQILNMYGPTETTIWSAVGPAGDGTDEGVAPLGAAIANTQLYILDGAGGEAPPGVPGELAIGGLGVTRGYWERPELTADRFRPDPFAGDAGARMYLTGDLVARQGDGTFTFLGRTDHQVKIRGYRIELGEIEAVIGMQAGITGVVVLAREDTPGDQRLVAYVTPASADRDAIAAAVADRLPPQMQPQHIVALDAFPLTPNAKIDRKALPPHQAEAAAPAATAPSAPATAPAGTDGDPLPRLIEIWGNVLGVTGIGPQDHFFQLGGHSLLAVRASREIRAAFGDAAVSITDIFRFPVLGDLARHIGGGDSPKGPDNAPPSNEDQAEIMSQRRALRARRGAG